MIETRLDPKSRHYDQGGIEALDIIKAKLTPEQYRGFLLDNIIKYACRANFKGQFGRDMEKAAFYNRFLQEAGPSVPLMVTLSNQAPDPLPEDGASTLPAPGVLTEELTRQVEDLGFKCGRKG